MGLVLQPFPKAHGDIPKREYQSLPPSHSAEGEGPGRGLERTRGRAARSWGSTPCTQDHGKFTTVLKNVMGEAGLGMVGAVGGLAGGASFRQFVLVTGNQDDLLHVPVMRAFLGSGILSVCTGDAGRTGCGPGLVTLGHLSPPSLAPRLCWLKGWDQIRGLIPALQLVWPPRVLARRALGVVAPGLPPGGDCGVSCGDRVVTLTDPSLWSLKDRHRTPNQAG